MEDHHSKVGSSLAQYTQSVKFCGAKTTINFSGAKTTINFCKAKTTIKFCKAKTTIRNRCRTEMIHSFFFFQVSVSGCLTSGDGKYMTMSYGVSAVEADRNSVSVPKVLKWPLTA
jgi:hypothetical protein